ncbi:hypothetical protein GGTG_10987 [Gaeumannomyces tritici R3-111a-1]|uniref:Uncharacterized protein n=1 Tax=Gaeumannomyces tritici (strain R3-111a-1) TaxID=644352 RepID=J3PBW3_GAET3|nr:hypothetical protein GGTG_10987 [Gaeumannomyces tritici R3-111a-1]EJT71733.1 hypothetical protein GGTG_10987 [Gaeumannomyces tritici R3-111a-1]
MPASYQYRGQSIMAKLKNKIKLKLLKHAHKNLNKNKKILLNNGKVLRKAKLFLNFLYLKNRQFGKILPIILTITNLFLKAKRNATVRTV